MSNTVKSIILICCFVAIGVLGYMFYPLVFETIMGNKYYTSQQAQDLYDKGFNDGNKNRTELEEKNTYFETLVNEYYSKIDDLNKELDIRKSENELSTKTIEELSNSKQELENQVNSLTTIKQENELTITEQEDSIKDLQRQVKELQSQYNTCQDEISNLTNQVENLQILNARLQQSNSENQNTILSLNSQINELQLEVNSLSYDKENNLLTIRSLNARIETLQNTVDELNEDVEDKNSQIFTVNIEANQLRKQISDLTNSNLLLESQITSHLNQISNLESSNTLLQNTNIANQNTILLLNNQIISLNTQISELSLQIQNNTSNASSLNNRIKELEKSVAYYEQYISSLETNNEVIVTFEFNGSVYNIQVIAKNSTTTVLTPTSTAYIIFNGWCVNGEIIDLETFTFTTNTKVIADVTYKYDVNFVVDESNYNTQIITKNDFASLPTQPAKEGYAFMGWSKDGTNIVNVTTLPITENTTYTAIFEKTYSVSFVFNNETISQQTIIKGNYATVPTIENTDYIILNGWKVNNTNVDVTNFIISSDTVFVADLTFAFDVKFYANDELVDSQIVINGQYATLPQGPQSNQEGFVFAGWSVDNRNIITSLQITKNTNVYAIFRDYIDIRTSDYVSKQYTSINFDYYTGENEYLVNNVNVIENIEPLKTIKQGNIIVNSYVKDTTLYVLSNVKMRLSNNGNSSLFQSCQNLTSLNLNNFDTSILRSFSNMFFYCKGLTSLDLSKFDTSSATDMGTMFSGCSNLKSLDLSNFNTSKVTRMKQMFSTCWSLTSLDLSSFNTSNVTNMHEMFYMCKELTSLNINSFNTSKVTNMSGMFSTCSKLTAINVSHFDTSSVTEMGAMFAMCESLTSLDVSNFDTSKVTNANSMFGTCKKLVSLNLGNFELDSLTSLHNMFGDCFSLITLDLSSFDTKNITNMEYLFDGCQNLVTIYVSDLWDISAVTSYTNMFHWCFDLVSQTSGVAFDSSRTTVLMANYTTGYLTYKEFVA